MGKSFVAMPKEITTYNGGIKCDMLVGTCSCGAWHVPGEIAIRLCKELSEARKKAASCLYCT